MMRCSRSLRAAAALVAPQPPCASAAQGAQLVHRILGRMNTGATCAKSFGEIIDKSAGTKAAAYAHLGRAMVFLNSGEDKLALLDVQAAEKAAGPANRLVASLKFQCAARLLAEERRKLTISGATNELEMANRIQAVDETLKALATASGSDYAAAIAAGEYYLYYGNDAAAAEKHFANAVKLARDSAKPSIASKGTASPEAVAAADVEKTTEELAQLKCKHITVAPVVADKKSLESLRSTFADGLTDAQLTLLGSVLACETRGGVVFDAAFSSTDDYGPWTSDKAASVSRRIAQVYHPLVENHATTVQKPQRAFSMEGATAADLVKSCPADKHILDHIGSVPTSQVTSSDAEFFKALEQLNAASAHTVPADNAAAAEYFASLAADLMAQVVARATVGLAEAQTELGKVKEAQALLREVESADSYVDMWRLLAAKGKLYRKIGKIDEADKAFQKLHALKLQKPGNDIPLMDEHRYKSAF